MPFPSSVGAGEGYPAVAREAESGGTRTIILDCGDTVLSTWRICGNAVSVCRSRLVDIQFCDVKSGQAHQ